MPHTPTPRSGPDSPTSPAPGTTLARRPEPRRSTARTRRRTGVTALVAAASMVGALVLALVPAGAAQAAPVLLSQGKPATASSTENGAFPASAAVDGNAGSRWSSAFSDPQWLQVDLGAPAQITRVALTWETAAARAFQIQVSNDATTWTSIYS